MSLPSEGTPLAAGTYPEIIDQVRRLGLDPAAVTTIDLPNRPLPILATTVASAQAVAEWERLHNLASQGWSPVYATGETFDDIWDTVDKDSATPAEHLRAASLLSFPDWLARARQQIVDDPEGAADEFWDLREGDYQAAKGAGAALDSQRVVTEQDVERITLLLVPTPHSWQIPAWLEWWGGVNYDLDPPHHVMVLRSWHERFGADLIGLSLSTMEVRVPVPITDRATAETIAREQYLVDPDVIQQGVETMGALVANVEGARNWWFWWD